MKGFGMCARNYVCRRLVYDNLDNWPQNVDKIIEYSFVIRFLSVYKRN